MVLFAHLVPFMPVTIAPVTIALTSPPPAQILFITAPPQCRARDMRPLWRDLILKVLGSDPLKCLCCPGTMKPDRTFHQAEQIEFFLHLHGLWEGVIFLPRPLPSPFDIEIMERIEPPWQAIQGMESG